MREFLTEWGPAVEVPAKHQEVFLWGIERNATMEQLRNHFGIDADAASEWFSYYRRKMPQWQEALLYGVLSGWNMPYLMKYVFNQVYGTVKVNTNDLFR